MHLCLHSDYLTNCVTVCFAQGAKLNEYLNCTEIGRKLVHV